MAEDLAVRATAARFNCSVKLCLFVVFCARTDQKNNNRLFSEVTLKQKKKTLDRKIFVVVESLCSAISLMVVYFSVKG